MAQHPTNSDEADKGGHAEPDQTVSAEPKEPGKLPNENPSPISTLFLLQDKTKAWISRYRKWVPIIARAVLGLALVLWSGIRLKEIFSEHNSVSTTSLTIMSAPGCESMSNAFIILNVTAKGVMAAISPSFSGALKAPTCIVVGSERLFHIIPSSDRGPGSVDLSTMPKIIHRHSGNVDIWSAKVFFDPLPTPTTNQFQPIRHNVALELDLEPGLSRPSYTTARLDMVVSLMTSPTTFSIKLGGDLQLIDFSSPTSNYWKGGGLINVHVDGVSLFHMEMNDLARQRLKDIFLLIAGGLLMLGLTCAVDSALKSLELISEGRNRLKDGTASSE